MTSQHCHSCFETNQGIYPCPHCHWSPETPSKSQLYLQPGTLLHGRYEIGKVLHHGKFSTIYLAWNIKEEKKIAIKEFLPVSLVSRNSTGKNLSAIPNDKNAKKKFHFGLERFLDEALTLTKFQKQANMVSVYSLFKANDTGYMVMEYVEGIALHRYIKNKGTLTWLQTLGLFARIMGLLNDVHQQGLIHSGISPNKIYLCKNNQFKLLGFSEAKHALGQYMHSIAETNQPGYAAEEQYQPREPQGPWTDIYALAASMYFCLTGQTPPEAILRVNSDTLIKPSLLNIDIPVTAELALLRGLAVQASLRPQSLLQFYSALTRQMQDVKTALAETINKPVIENQPAPSQPDPASNATNLEPPQAPLTGLKVGAGLLLGCFIAAVSLVINMSPSATPTSSEVKQTEEQSMVKEFNHAMILKKQGRDELALPIFMHLAEQGYTKAQAILDLMHEEDKITDQDSTAPPQKNTRPQEQTQKPVLKREYTGLVAFDPTPNVDANTKQIGLAINDKQTFFGFDQTEKQFNDEDNLLPPTYQPTAELGIPPIDSNNVDPANSFNNTGLDLAETQALLGKLYFEGNGVLQDYNQALYWYQKAAGQGEKSAISSLKQLQAPTGKTNQ